jgi:hypothetical protein
MVVKTFLRVWWMYELPRESQVVASGERSDEYSGYIQTNKLLIT